MSSSSSSSSDGGQQPVGILQPSQGLLVYATNPPKSTTNTIPLHLTHATANQQLTDSDAVPSYQRSIARVDGKEDEDYYKDVENIASSRTATLFKTTSPINFMIRLSAESTAFYTGSGWRSYDKYIGAPILYPTYTEEIRKSVFESTRVQAAIIKVAADAVRVDLLLNMQQQGKLTKTHFISRMAQKIQHMESVASTYMDSLVADLSSKNAVRFMAFFVNNMLVRMFNQGIHIKEAEFLQIRNAAQEAREKKVSLIFLPCHKSHVDYLVISYIFFRLGIALPHIAAGENLNIPVVGWLLQHGGAFYIRRKFGNDPIYQELVREYVECLLKRGHNLELFVEGTRSRIGKLLQPKFGLLKIILDSVLSGAVKDAIIVPMSIDYDKVIETETYANELMGSPKEKESLTQVVNNASILNLKLGRIDIRFAKPYSLRDFIDSESKKRTTPSELFSPNASATHKAVLLKSLGFRVLSDINSVCTIMPTALVGTVILTLRGRGVGQDELVRRVTWLRREILIKGGRVADFGGTPTSIIVARAVTALGGLVDVRKDLLEPVFYVAKRFELSLFRNQVMHLFLQEAIVAAAMYATIKKGQTQRRIHIDSMLNDVAFLSQLLKNEFIFRPGNVESNTFQTLLVLQDHNVITLENVDGSKFEASSSPWINVTSPLGNAGKLRTSHPFWIRLSDAERSIGRENFDFYCFLIWSFIETYWLAAAGLFSLLPSPPIGGLTEKEMTERVQHFGRTLYYEGDLGYFESINKDTLKNAFQRYTDMGLLSSIMVTIKPAFPADMQDPHGKQHMPRPAEQVQLYFVTEQFAKENVAFLVSDDGGQSGDGGATVFHTQLWHLVENIGMFRREGKHRRDNETTGKRTLRIARMARTVFVPEKSKI